MKGLKIMLFSLLLLSCRENIDETTITGTWKLTEQLVDPGDGSGKFTPVSSNKTVTFVTNGTYTSNGSFCSINTDSNQNTNGNYTYTNSEKSMTPLNCNTTLFSVEKLSIEIQNGNLIISNFGCIEPCAQKFVKIKN
ncbi:hypothetical protein [Cloacibacterium sp.]|uniref:hypothetical protein n=1 Tax=Cloacibacterium sp. TaxID=1913682 RepID=UPI0039E382DC